ncbi:unnamed protein product [Rotaria magnacalcarata]|uniref:L-Fucosyltransferase n=1 Tax=Rotaria magnacalcarata TaxID=392030 RepID=A0A816DN39_9BILA|nr:unnamed protein product [Rotaria magnacalcarata]CAF4597512.1 unnamed protein product [Rotaria magnacalcarata]
MVLLEKAAFSSNIHYIVGILFIIVIAIGVTTRIQKFNPVRYPFPIHSKNQSVLTQSSSQKSNITCIVYVVNSGGRLGNRMFMVASAYGLARLHSCHLYFTPVIIDEMKLIFIFDLSRFLISTTMFNSIMRNLSKQITKESRSITCQYIPELTRPNAISSGRLFELQGYWQSYLHFHVYRDELRNQIFIPKQSVIERVSKLFIHIYKRKFKFKPNFSLGNHQLFKKQLTQSKWITWIRIHVRRTDFLLTNYSSSDEYLLSSIEYYKKRYANAHFIVASDDKRYCINLFRHQPNIFITSVSFSNGDDLIALSLCQHSIVTGGTFSWWAAYLTSGEVIHDKVYPSGCERDEYYYPPWFMLPEQIRAHNNSNYAV